MKNIITALFIMIAVVCAGQGNGFVIAPDYSTVTPPTIRYQGTHDTMASIAISADSLTILTLDSSVIVYLHFYATAADYPTNPAPFFFNVPSAPLRLRPATWFPGAAAIALMIRNYYVSLGYVVTGTF